MRVAIYAGTFDPITHGHLSVVDRGARLFDELWIVVAVNPTKHPLFSGEERVQMIREVTARWPNVQTTTISGYVVDLAREYGAGYMIRGVRGATDAEAELALANLNHELAPEIETVFVPAHPHLSVVSSSRLKELVLHGEDISPYCSDSVARRLTNRLSLSPAEPEETAHV
ncbi:MAG: pantetheine-phosphate adenylyltransferase [Polyangiaceae bacterium]